MTLKMRTPARLQRPGDGNARVNKHHARRIRCLSSPRPRLDCASITMAAVPAEKGGSVILKVETPCRSAFAIYTCGLNAVPITLTVTTASDSSASERLTLTLSAIDLPAMKTLGDITFKSSLPCSELRLR